MGNFLSTDRNDEDDEDAIVVDGMTIDPIPPPLFDQLDNGLPSDPIDWADVLRRLRLRPEEASLYCHSIEPSPLQVALSRTNPPPPARVVRALLDAYPDAAFHGDAHDEMPLHVAAGNASVDMDPAVVRMLLAANVNAASVRIGSGSGSGSGSGIGTKRGDGRLPLHLAWREEDVRNLVEAHPAGVVARDCKGRIPLHYLVSAAPSPCLGAVRCLVDGAMARRRSGGSGGGSISRDREGRTPLRIVGDRFEEVAAALRRRKNEEAAAAAAAPIAAATTHDQGGYGNRHRNDVEITEGRLWEVMELMIRASADGSYRPKHRRRRSDSRGRSVPALPDGSVDGPRQDGPDRNDDNEDDIGSGDCLAPTSIRSETPTLPSPPPPPPPLLLLTAKQRRPSFLLVHAAIELGCPPSVVSRALSLRPHEASERDERGRTPLALAAARKGGRDGACTAASLSVLIQSDPRAARVMDTSGLLPIDLAAENGRDFHDGMVELVMAAPLAVETRAVGNRMYPFMAAAVGETSNLNSVYGLLILGPGVIEHLVVSCKS